MTGGFLGNDISYSPKTPNSQKKEDLESAFCDTRIWRVSTKIKKEELNRHPFCVFCVFMSTSYRYIFWSEKPTAP